jgi:hypothetical protein
LAQRRWALIADDLTGACDAAAAFAQAGFTTSVVLDETRLADCESELAAYSSETRNADEAQAVFTTERACDRVMETGRFVLFVKIDSVLRGSPLAEVEAVSRRLGGIPAVLTPAMPAQGRLVIDGSLCVVDTDTGRPLQPPSKIPAGPNMRVADAASFGDLQRLAAECLSTSNPPLFAGSAVSGCGRPELTCAPARAHWSPASWSGRGPPDASLSCLLTRVCRVSGTPLPCQLARVCRVPRMSGPRLPCQLARA